MIGAMNEYGVQNGAIHNMNGRIYGIGVGIGDPEDITLKAIKIIKTIRGCYVQF